MPLSERLRINIHWYERSWPCAGAGCRLCGLVPARPVSYFAALGKVGQNAAALCFVERSDALLDEVLRQSALQWSEGLSHLVVSEETRGRSIEVSGFYVFEQQRQAVVPFARLAYSVARLFRMPSFPECPTPESARRAVEAYSARLQALQFSSAMEVPQ